MVAVALRDDRRLEVLQRRGRGADPLVVLFVALNQIEGYILQPMVMGREVKLHPAMVIVSFLIFGALLGVVGVLLAVPAAVLCATLLDEWFQDEPTAHREGV